MKKIHLALMESAARRLKTVPVGFEMILILLVICAVSAGFMAASEHPGLTLLRKNGCLVCHSIDGSKLVGPTFKGFYGSIRTEVTPGGVKKIVADPVFIKRAVYEPDGEMALGFGKSLMKTYKDIISEEDLNTIIEYMKTLSTNENKK